MKLKVHSKPLKKQPESTLPTSLSINTYINNKNMENF